jgi:hypothetical protein
MYFIFQNIEHGMTLHPQDVVVVLKLIAKASRRWTYSELSGDLCMSTSQVFNAVARAEKALLLAAVGGPDSLELSNGEPRVWLLPHRSNIKEFLIHGVKYVFPVERGGSTRGVPTAEGALPLSKYFPQDSHLLPVWPHPMGLHRGISFSPIYKNVPQAALKDEKLHELLSLLDAIREGRAREREIAIRELIARIDRVGEQGKASV